MIFELGKIDRMKPMCSQLFGILSMKNGLSARLFNPTFHR